MHELVPKKINKIAIIMPIAYGGGSLRGALMLAEALQLGSQLANEPVEIVFAHLEEQSAYLEALPKEAVKKINSRVFQWRLIDAFTAKKITNYDIPKDQPAKPSYLVMDDGICFMADCDLWIIISDRLPAPLLPLKPYIVMVYDYIQRYIPEVCLDDRIQIQAARDAAAVWTTTEQAHSDVLQYAGVDPKNAVKLPMLVPNFTHYVKTSRIKETTAPYFIWTTNLGLHKNHYHSLLALKYYYEDFDGQLACEITGINTQKLFEQTSLSELIDSSAKLQKSIHLNGNLTDKEYSKKLSAAAFLWHSAKIDNGTFSVIEAHQLGIPSLSSNYPAMREINDTFELNLAWMDADNPLNMAQQIKWMEETYHKFSIRSQSTEKIGNHYAPAQAKEYWGALRSCF